MSDTENPDRPDATGDAAAFPPPPAEQSAEHADEQLTEPLFQQHSVPEVPEPTRQYDFAPPTPPVPPAAHPPAAHPPAAHPAQFGYPAPQQFGQPAPVPVQPEPKPERGRVSGWTWPLVSALALVLGVVGGFVGASLADDDDVTVSPNGIEVETRKAAPLPADNASIAAVAAKVLPSTVQIIAEYDGEDQGATGSGFVFDKQGHVITNNHVVAQAAEDDGPIVVIDQDGEHREASVVGRSAVYDIAVLRRHRRGPSRWAKQPPRQSHSSTCAADPQRDHDGDGRRHRGWRSRRRSLLARRASGRRARAQRLTRCDHLDGPVGRKRRGRQRDRRRRARLPAAEVVA